MAQAEVSPLPTLHPSRGDEVPAALTALYNWNYDSEIDSLRTLYANALERQWIALRDLDWSREIDREAFSNTFSMGGIPIQQTRLLGRASIRARAGRCRGARPPSCSRTSCTASRAR